MCVCVGGGGGGGSKLNSSGESRISGDLLTNNACCNSFLLRTYTVDIVLKLYRTNFLNTSQSVHNCF